MTNASLIIYLKQPHKIFSFNVSDESFDLMDGVLGMALSPYTRGHDRFLYYHSLAATTENVVNTRIIRNNSYSDDPNIDPDSVYVSWR